MECPRQNFYKRHEREFNQTGSFKCHKCNNSFKVQDFHGLYPPFGKEVCQGCYKVLLAEELENNQKKLAEKKRELENKENELAEAERKAQNERERPWEKMMQEEEEKWERLENLANKCKETDALTRSFEEKMRNSNETNSEPEGPGGNSNSQPLWVISIISALVFIIYLLTSEQKSKKKKTLNDKGWIDYLMIRKS